MARAVTTQRKTLNTAVAWGIGLLIFFPILWTVLTSFKTEAQAINDPPLFLFFDWTLENYSVVQERSNYMRFLWNSVIIAGGSTLLGIIVAVPAAWSMAFVPSKRTKDILMWMLSTKMLPAVGVLYPIYLMFIQLGLLDTRIGLVIVNDEVANLGHHLASLPLGRRIIISPLCVPRAAPPRERHGEPRADYRPGCVSG